MTWPVACPCCSRCPRANSWPVFSARTEEEQLAPIDTHEISAARWGTTGELAGPIRARLLETGRALWRYRVELHEAALDQLEQLR